MAQRPGNRRHPCFCRKSCPDIYVPYLKYRFRAPDSNFSAYHDWKLIVFQLEVDDDLCIWVPAEPLPPSPPVAFVQDLRKVTFGAMSYKWRFHLQELPNNENYDLDVTWTSEEEITSGESPACDSLVMLLTEIVSGDEADLEAVPEWMCTDQDALDWKGG